MKGPRYMVEATDDGYRMTLMFAESNEGSIKGISLETEGGHDELESLFAQAEQTWHTLRARFEADVFERLR